MQILVSPISPSKPVGTEPDPTKAFKPSGSGVIGVGPGSVPADSSVRISEIERVCL
jgi:hypothetical protein